MAKVPVTISKSRQYVLLCLGGFVDVMLCSLHQSALLDMSKIIVFEWTKEDGSGVQACDDVMPLS